MAVYSEYRSMLRPTFGMDTINMELGVGKYKMLHAKGVRSTRRTNDCQVIGMTPININSSVWGTGP